MKTDAQRAADEAMNEAVQAAITAYELIPQGGMLVDYVCVVEALRYPDGDDHFDEYYGVIVRGGQMRSSTACGMLDKGKEVFRFAGILEIGESDDDE